MTTHVTTDAARSRLQVRGELSGEAGSALYAAAQTLGHERPAAVVIDLSAVPRMDSLGGAWLSRAAAALRQEGVAFRVEGAHGQVEDFLRLIRPTFDEPPPPRPAAPGFLKRLAARPSRVSQRHTKP